MSDDSEMIVCENGEELPREECAQLSDGTWLPIDECAQTCDGEWIHADESLVLADGSVVHEDRDDICYRADGEWDWQEDCVYLHGEWYSDDDCCDCHTCNETCLSDDMYESPDGDSICRCCYEHNVSSCENCGCECWSDDMHYDEDSCESLCTECHETRSSRLIQPYSNKEANHLRSESRDTTLYGVELEVEDRSGDPERSAEWVRQYLDERYCVLKSDGSLGEGGFEIVTRPDSVEVHQRMWEKAFTANPTTMMSSWSNGRCGMHVHVSKRGLSQLQLGKMLVFLNNPSNESLVTQIAGRRSERWCKIHAKKVSDVLHRDERYVALNIGTRTAEFRIFKGTLSRSGFFKNLEFCKALVEFTAPSQRSIAEATSWLSFCQWVSYKDYPNLYDFLVRKRFITDRRPRKAA